jgi:sodium/bile acid cotransporter 7
MTATVAIAALFPAQGRGASVVGAAADAGIIFLFFLYGVRLSTSAALRGMLHWRLHLAVLLSTFALFPVLGAFFQPIASGWLPKALVSGVMFLCVLPSTVQSSIAFTSIARGNVPAALCAASASNMIGVFLSPLLAGWLLHAHGVALSYEVFQDILLQLMAPFVVGQLLRRWIGDWVQIHRTVLSYADRGSILLIIYVAFSKGMVEGIWQQIGVSDLIILIAALALLLVLALFITGFIGRRVLRLDTEDQIVLQFCGSKKSLASGLPMAGILFPASQVGLIVLPLMIFHQMQLIVCAILARHYAARPDEPLPEAGLNAKPASS